jgi:MerR family transcriptional regulator, redox-sensitive transcriptional activator SoxR
MTIGQVAKEAGLRASAIRFYEKAGLLPRPLRASGQRRYDAGVLARLAVVKRAKDCGFTLEEARQLFNDRGRPRERWERVAMKKVAELDALMQKIAAMKELLEKRCACSDLDECGRRILEAQPLDPFEQG